MWDLFLMEDFISKKTQCIHQLFVPFNLGIWESLTIDWLVSVHTDGSRPNHKELGSHVWMCILHWPSNVRHLELKIPSEGASQDQKWIPGIITRYHKSSTLKSLSPSLISQLLQVKHLFLIVPGVLWYFAKSPSTTEMIQLYCALFHVLSNWNCTPRNAEKTYTRLPENSNLVLDGWDRYSASSCSTNNRSRFTPVEKGLTHPENHDMNFDHLFYARGTHDVKEVHKHTFDSFILGVVSPWLIHMQHRNTNKI